MKYERTCEAYFEGITPKWLETITLTWQDNSDNEDSFRILKDNLWQISLPPNSTTAVRTLHYNQGTGGPLWDYFQVEAFNWAGPSAKAGVDVPRCP